jgi:hypothetical protein
VQGYAGGIHGGESGENGQPNVTLEGGSGSDMGDGGGGVPQRHRRQL